MTEVIIPTEAIHALKHGRYVKLTHPDLGLEGRNGAITLRPEDRARGRATVTDFEVLDK